MITRAHKHNVSASKHMSGAHMFASAHTSSGMHMWAGVVCAAPVRAQQCRRDHTEQLGGGGDWPAQLSAPTAGGAAARVASLITAAAAPMADGTSLAPVGVVGPTA